jgi:hypothetical protein
VMMNMAANVVTVQPRARPGTCPSEETSGIAAEVNVSRMTLRHIAAYRHI